MCVFREMNSIALKPIAKLKSNEAFLLPVKYFIEGSVGLALKIYEDKSRLSGFCGPLYNLEFLASNTLIFPGFLPQAPF